MKPYTGLESPVGVNRSSGYAVIAGYERPDELEDDRRDEPVCGRLLAGGGVDEPLGLAVHAHAGGVEDLGQLAVEHGHGRGHDEVELRGRRTDPLRLGPKTAPSRG